MINYMIGLKRLQVGLSNKCLIFCGKIFKNLRTHISFVHKKVANSPCDQCSTRFVTSTDREKHISSVHLKEKIICPECGVTVAFGHLGMYVRRKHSGKVKIQFT